MNEPKPIHFNVSTPVGKYALTTWSSNDGFAAIAKEAMGPDDLSAPREFLQYRRGNVSVTAEPDGVWIGARHLFAIATGRAKQWRRPITPRDVEQFFYQPLRPDVTAEFARLAKTYMPEDTWWRQMYRHGSYDPATGIITPVLRQ